MVLVEAEEATPYGGTRLLDRIYRRMLAAAIELRQSSLNEIDHGWRSIESLGPSMRLVSNRTRGARRSGCGVETAEEDRSSLESPALEPVSK